jgi:hypothetical protein
MSAAVWKEPLRKEPPRNEPQRSEPPTPAGGRRDTRRMPGADGHSSVLITAVPVITVPVITVPAPRRPIGERVGPQPGDSSPAEAV